MKSIHRYEVPVDDLRHRIRLCGDIVHVAARNPRIVEFWAVHSEGGDSTERVFLVVGTGQPLPLDLVRVIGTAVVPPLPLLGDPGLVWHLLEVQP